MFREKILDNWQTDLLKKKNTEKFKYLQEAGEDTIAGLDTKAISST